MSTKLYDLMNWEKIEGIVYSDDDHPKDFLGGHVVKDGILIQAFIPDAKSVTVKNSATGRKTVMECMDENGFYAALLKGKKVPEYTLLIEKEDGTVTEQADPYSFEQILTDADLMLFENGVHYQIYEKLGAHPMVVNGVSGVLFAVWAPNAVKVSVVGDFNHWDGRCHLMQRLGSYGVFELFIPGLGEGEIYKYEIKHRGEKLQLKADPYGFGSEFRPNTASVVRELSGYEWKDSEWMESRKVTDTRERPMAIYEVHLGSFRKPENPDDIPEKEFYNYREIAPILADYVKSLNYTHIELLPIMEHPLDESWGYQVTGYYAPTSRYGSAKDLMYFIDYMHQQGIGVILDWVAAHFPRDVFGLASFDGTALYEHWDPRRGSHPHWGTLIFNYGRPQVANFLIANALYWVDKYHADGIRMDAVASMLYLDYGKQNGEWVPNIYGGNEILEAVELIRRLSQAMKARKDGALLIAEESTAWPKVTGEIKDGGLGFDYKWNMGWMNDFTNYLKCDPLFRKNCHGDLTFSMVYAYSENFVLVLSHDEVVHGKGSLIQKMPGEEAQKLANLRVAYGFMTAHPGKKLLFMGQEFGQTNEWCEKKELDWKELEEKKSRQQLQSYVRDLNAFYQSTPALYLKDYDSEGFEWLSCLDADHSIVTFLRKTGKISETILVVCNFTPVVYEDFRIGVPFKGKYKEIFSSDDKKYGGEGRTNTRLKQSQEVSWDGRENSISITVPSMGMAVFRCTPLTKAELKNEAEKKEARLAKEAADEAVEEAQRAELAAIDAEKAAKNARLLAAEKQKMAEKARVIAKEKEEIANRPIERGTRKSRKE